MAALFSFSPNLKANVTFSAPRSFSIQRPNHLRSPTPISTISTTHWTKRGRPICSHGTPTPTKTREHKRRSPPQNLTVFSDGKDRDEGRPVCPGCGVFMQDIDPNLPGYYRKRESKEGDLDDNIMEGDVDEGDDDEDGHISDSDSDLGEDVLMGHKGGDDDESSDFDYREIEDDDLDEERWMMELDGFTPAGVGYGNVSEETLKKQKREKVSKAEKKRRARETRRAVEDDGATVCARCHSLRHYGQVKNQTAENLIPDFDFDRLIVASLMKPASTAPVVVMVVECVDFDGSFPKRAVKSLFKVLEGGRSSAKLAKSPKLVLVATKVDLLPSQISPTRLDRWVRNRAKAWGAPKLSGVYLVSAHKDLGIRNLLSFIKESSGPRSNVWVIGAQNAGKSTLINAFAKKEGVKATRLTEAAVPGTTLGIVRIGNVLPDKAKMYDTPGLLHPYLMSMRLNREEQKMVEIKKELRPRTYRVKAGQTVYVGGVARLDVTKMSVETIYVTIWASPSISLHMGKTESADEIWNNHVGVRLQPPIGQDRLSELGQWVQREMKVSGLSWEVKSSDIAIAGLGWFSLGLKGEATVVLWTYDGVEVTKRDPLVLDRAPFLERPGFLLPKAISDAVADRGKNATEAKRSKAQKQDFLMEASI